MTGGRRVAVIGLPFFARRTAQSLRSVGFDARFIPQPGRSIDAWPRVVAEIMRADLVYAIGSGVSRFSPLHLISMARKPIVLHWVGSDVEVALQVYRTGHASNGLLDRAVHWADAPWLVDELAELGVIAKELLLPVPAAVGSPLPLPDDFRVLLYLPREFQSAYRVEATMEVVRQLPGIRFMVAGGFRPERAIPNLEVLGFVHDMPAVYARSTAFLRLTHHDGMSHSVIEALSFGRHVLWNYPFRGVTRVESAPEAIAALSDIADRHSRGTLPLNSDAASYVAARYNPDKMLSEVRDGLEALLP
ncbi:MAG TPA: hypothetical protein VFK32_00265 [Tepidiformaceae bacterium]|nr:hypothetical protein [Tepidiformaceae bacterium]